MNEQFDGSGFLSTSIQNYDVKRQTAKALVERKGGEYRRHDYEEWRSWCFVRVRNNDATKPSYQGPLEAAMDDACSGYHQSNSLWMTISKPVAFEVEKGAHPVHRPNR
jgi:hypothetical protein